MILGHELGLWELEGDPRSSDFMKLRVGRLRSDPWGGYQQYAVLYGRILSGMQSKGIQEGKVGFRGDLAERWLRSGASPIIQNALTALTGRDFKGTEVERSDWKYWLKTNMMFSVQDSIEAFENEGLLGLAVGIPAATVGTGLYGVPPTLQDVSRDIEEHDYDDLPTGTPGQLSAPRARVKRELERRLNEREKADIKKGEQRTEERAKEREERRNRIYYGR